MWFSRLLPSTTISERRMRRCLRTLLAGPSQAGIPLFSCSFGYPWRRLPARQSVKTKEKSGRSQTMTGIAASTFHFSIGRLATLKCLKQPVRRLIFWRSFHCARVRASLFLLLHLFHGGPVCYHGSTDTYLVLYLFLDFFGSILNDARPFVRYLPISPLSTHVGNAW